LNRVSQILYTILDRYGAVVCERIRNDIFCRFSSIMHERGRQTDRPRNGYVDRSSSALVKIKMSYVNKKYVGKLVQSNGYVPTNSSKHAVQSRKTDKRYIAIDVTVLWPLTFTMTARPSVISMKRSTVLQ